METEAKAQAQAKQRKLDLVLADGSVYPEKGEFSFAERQVDVKTGTIRIAAVFPNPGNLLRPGQFGRVRAVMDTKKGAIMVPQRAVMELAGKLPGRGGGFGQQGRHSARQNRRARGQPVGHHQRPAAGERVIVEGIQKVKQGMVVNPKAVEPEAKPQSAPAAKPEAKPAANPAPKKD